ncbi:MAG: hypothetical protein R3A47_07045 [Polyangiales bacterium]
MHAHAGDPMLTDVNEAAKKTAQLLSTECEQLQIELRLDLEPNLPSVRIDIERLRQVLINLIRNSMQALASSGSITVQTRSRDRVQSSAQRRDWIELAVIDSSPEYR